jgi:hypothetical protein
VNGGEEALFHFQNGAFAEVILLLPTVHLAHEIYSITSQAQGDKHLFSYLHTETFSKHSCSLTFLSICLGETLLFSDFLFDASGMRN